MKSVGTDPFATSFRADASLRSYPPLIRSHSLAELIKPRSGRLNQSLSCFLNMVRNRAGLGDYVFRTLPRLVDEIRNERARELFGEFQRKFDLVRWGIWYDAVQDNTDSENLRENMLPCHEYYPIPETEVVNSKNNLDNKEYNKYGL